VCRPCSPAVSRSEEYDWQFWVTANHYRIREDAKWIPERPLLNQAFVYRRSLVVGAAEDRQGAGRGDDHRREAVGPTCSAGGPKPRRGIRLPAGRLPVRLVLRLRAG
jgi:hypothetical protein